MRLIIRVLPIHEFLAAFMGARPNPEFPIPLSIRLPTLPNILLVINFYGIQLASVGFLGFSPFAIDLALAPDSVFINHHYLSTWQSVYFE